MSILLRTLLIVGLMISPLTNRVFAGGDHSMHMSQPPADTISDEASNANSGTPPCHDGTMDCGKNCPCMTLCMSLGVLGLPSAAATIASLFVVGERIAVPGDIRLANLPAAPPAPPPRA